MSCTNVRKNKLNNIIIDFRQRDHKLLPEGTLRGVPLGEVTLTKKVRQRKQDRVLGSENAMPSKSFAGIPISPFGNHFTSVLSETPRNLFVPLIIATGGVVAQHAPHPARIRSSMGQESPQQKSRLEFISSTMRIDFDIRCNCCKFETSVRGCDAALHAAS